MPDLTASESLVEGLLYPEAPRWRDGRLWVADVHSFRLKACSGDGRVVVDIEVPERPSGLGFLPDGRLLMATGLGRRLHVVDGEAVLLAADLSSIARGLLNDMVVDGRGRAYVGDTGFNLGAGEDYRPGQILLFEEGAGVRQVADDVNFPNGMAITPDGQTLYVAETFASRITAFDVAANGSLNDRRLHVEVDGTPDGLCLDADGALWVATLARGQFQRIDADGHIVERIDVAPRQAVACMLGGPERRTLFLCCATVERHADGSVRREGVIRPVTVPVAGAGLP